MNEIKTLRMPISTVYQNITTIIFSLLLHSFHGGKKNSRCSSHLNLDLKINMESTQLDFSPWVKEIMIAIEKSIAKLKVLNSIINRISFLLTEYPAYSSYFSSLHSFQSLG